MSEIPIEVAVLVIAGLLGVLLLVVRALIGVRRQYNEMRQRYAGLIDVDSRSEIA